MKKKVLVFPCGSEIGLEIFKSLNLSTHFELIGGSSSDDHGRFVYEKYIGDLPHVDNPDFVEEINKVVNQYDIDYIFPAHDSVVLRLAEEKQKNNLDCDVITSPVETCRITRSKLKTYLALNNVISTPRIYEDVDELKESDFPIFLKPDVGQGSKGTYKANNISEVKFYSEKDPSLLMLEFLPGKEYTIDCFTDVEGSILFCEGRERRRISNGISVNSTSLIDDRFRELAEKINKELQFKGVWFFQVKERHGGELVLMEVAPRVAGTMGLIRGKGVNLPLLSLFDAEGIKVSVLENEYTLEIDRALENKYKHDVHYSHVYIDFDDLIVFEGKVNPAVVAFIYQCINDKVQLHLLTRHLDDIQDTLKKFRMTQLFDEIVWIKDGKSKSAYIQENDAIFIDDSFAERKEVKENRNIPVFDGHMIESLMR